MSKCVKTMTKYQYKVVTGNTIQEHKQKYGWLHATFVVNFLRAHL